MTKRYDIPMAAAGVSAPRPQDWRANPFALSIAVRLNGGAMTYTVEHTFDDVYAATYTPAAGKWFATTGLTALTGDAEGNIAFPVTAVRVNVTAYTSGTGNCVLLQAGW